ncbi:hypothetical protein [Rhizobium sp. BK602]|uniref:hypothetical protein n=1 Tax=Rhizobium sp. BK602 TaxID=2586986 RepID=UPI00161D713D|nr:hypothetical protein [Rhizobium sp. BK602]MBB3609256.1 hypothetical protein [Rhizobium sp. BK602]
MIPDAANPSDIGQQAARVKYRFASIFAILCRHGSSFQRIQRALTAKLSVLKALNPRKTGISGRYKKNLGRIGTAFSSAFSRAIGTDCTIRGQRLG